MKHFFLALTFTLITSALNTNLAFACDQHELQFTGKAIRINHHSFNYNSKQICSYEILPMNTTTSQTCPLSENEIAGIRFIDANCSLTENTEISGIIVHRGSTFWVE
ncbi:MAG: hypothetical protein WA160_15960 [Pseudobdellovibrio sp.]